MALDDRFCTIFDSEANAGKDESFFVGEFSDAIQLYVFGNIEKKG